MQTIQFPSGHKSFKEASESSGGTCQSLDPIVECVRKKLLDRSQTGIKKYQNTLDRKDLTHLNFLVHAQEEALDFANYLERLIQDYE